jgi:tetratricopeptide (TPR) repeat protein
VTEPHERLPVTRWAEGAPDDELDGRLGELFRDAGAAEPLSKRELAAVALRFERHRDAGKRTFFRYATLLAIGMLSGTGVAVAGFGVAQFVERAWTQRNVDVAPAPPAPRPNRLTGSALAAPPAPTSVPAPEVPLAEARAVERAETPSPAASGVALARETELLAGALAALRRDANPARALVLLDMYDREFSRGALVLEAASARLDALLSLGRTNDALTLLDRLPLDRMPRRKELAVIRAELRAQGDPSRAVRDFDAALALGLSGGLEERALFGRAGSRFRSSATELARRDLEAYLERYPAGRFATEARARLSAPHGQ